MFYSGKFLKGLILKISNIAKISENINPKASYSVMEITGLTLQIFKDIKISCILENLNFQKFPTVQ